MRDTRFEYLGEGTILRGIVPLPSWFKKKVYETLAAQRREVELARRRTNGESGMTFDEAYELRKRMSSEGLVPWRRMAKSILRHASEASQNSELHGFEHWERVAATGIELCKETPGADAYVMSLFATFHDSRRFSDGADPGHGRRGAALARKLRGKLFEATDEQMTLLERACKGHTAGKVTSDPTIGCCWDGDRLDLGRVGIKPEPALLSTTAAKNLVKNT